MNWWARLLIRRLPYSVRIAIADAIRCWVDFASHKADPKYFRHMEEIYGEIAFDFLDHF